MLHFLVFLVTRVLLVDQVLPIFINLTSIFYKMLSEYFDGRLVFNVVKLLPRLAFITPDNLRLLYLELIKSFHPEDQMEQECSDGVFWSWPRRVAPLLVIYRLCQCENDITTNDYVMDEIWFGGYLENWLLFNRGFIMAFLWRDWTSRKKKLLIFRPKLQPGTSKI